MSRPPPPSAGATPTLASTSFSTDSATTTSRPAPHDTTHELPYGSTKPRLAAPNGRRLRPLAGRERDRGADAEPGGHCPVPDRAARPPAPADRRRLSVARPG